jgi:hypothetical protein
LPAHTKKKLLTRVSGGSARRKARTLARRAPPRRARSQVPLRGKAFSTATPRPLPLSTRRLKPHDDAADSRSTKVTTRTRGGGPLLPLRLPLRRLLPLLPRLRGDGDGDDHADAAVVVLGSRRRAGCRRRRARQAARPWASEGGSQGGGSRGRTWAGGAAACL